MIIFDRHPPAPRSRPGRPTARTTVRFALAFALAVAAVVPIGGLDASARTAAPEPAAPEPAAPTVSAAPAAPTGRAAPAAPAAGPDAGLQPTIQYEEALAHAADRISFTPGARVSVPFAPRPDDGWTVAGTSPRALPAGEATGRQMAAQPQGGLPAATPDVRATAPIRTPPAGPARGTIATSPAGAPISLTGVSGLRRQVFGFLPYWELADPSTSLDYGLLSTIAYFSVGVSRTGDLLKRNPDGSVTTGWAGWTSSRLTDVINAAHRKGTRVVLTLSIFAWTTGQAAVQGALLGDPAARTNLARQAAAAVRDRGADGINVDLEPLVAGHEDDFVALVRAIRAELDAIAPGYQLTFDTLGRIGNYPVERLTSPGAADAVFVMGYDYRTAASPIAGSIAPLAGPAYDLAETVLAYLDVVPASKIILGVPWYGRAWSTVSDALNARTQTGAQFGPSVAVPYTRAVDAAAAHQGARWDDREHVAWFPYQRTNCTTASGCVTTWRQVYYDDDRALRLKYDLVNRSGLRGVGIWALGYDGGRREPWIALADKFLRDTTPPEAGIRAFTGDQRDEGFLVDWTARDDYNGVVSYDVQVSTDGGPWTPWLTGTTAGADIWLARDGHTYAFRARAKDGKGNLGAWDVVTTGNADPTLAVGGFGRVFVDGLNARANPSTSAARRDTLRVGTLVAITGGPVSADGYTWYEVIEPIIEWNPVSSVRAGVWVAAAGGGTTYLAPAGAPNVTRVSAGIAGFSFDGAGSAGVGAAPAAVAHRAFSPNGDGSRDTIRLDWQARVAFDSLTLNVYRPDGTLLGSQPVVERTAGAYSLEWDGRTGGAVLPDGVYLLQLVGSAAGVTYAAPSARPVTGAQLAAYGVTIDTVAPTGGSAAISARRISPDGDGRLDTLMVTGSATGAKRWTFTVAPLVEGIAGAPVRTILGAGASAKVAWDGRADDGSVVPDGVYRLTLRNHDWAGNGPLASWDVVVDVRDPLVGVSVTPGALSPNGDGVDERTTIGWTSDERVRGFVRIRRGTTLVRRWVQATGTGATIAWDGRDTAGRRVPDGRYTVEAELADAAGNRVVRRATVTLDRTVGLLRWDRPAFLPGDGDALASSATASFRLTRAVATSLRVENASGRVVRNAWVGRTRGPGRVAWTWDGRDGHRAFVPAGRYVAVLTVTSPLGTSELRRPIVVDAFLVTTSASALTAGETLTLTIRPVEPLRAAPTVTFSQAGLGPVKVTATKGRPGTYTATFAVGTGPGPASIVVAARDSAGGTNVTRLAVTVR